LKECKILRIERVEKELDNIFDYPLTIISASMGYGKTTAVKFYLEDRGINYAWVSLIGSDGIETVFWNKFIQAIQLLNTHIGIKLNQLEFPKGAVGMQVIIDLIKEIPYGKDIVLVIDDYHIIESQKIDKLLELITLENIVHFHIVITTRTRPNFNNINLISKGLCYYISTNTLALSQNEIKEYFNLMNFQIETEKLEKIHNYTNGWVSAIYLILLGLKQGFTINENANINQLVEKNLYCTFDKVMQESLLYLSIFDSFTLEQASYTLKNNRTINILDKLLEQNAFIEFDDYTGIYKLHNVLLDYLRKKLLNSNLDVSEVYYRAGKWYFEHSDNLEASNFYYRSGKIEELLEIMNKPDFHDLSYLGYKLQEKIYSNNRNLCIKFPFPFLQIARNFILTGKTETVMQGIEIVVTMHDYFIKDIYLPIKIKNRILGELEIINIFIVFNDAQKMVIHAKKAYEFLDGGVSNIVIPQSEFSFGVPHFLYTYYKDSGKLKETLDCIVEGFPPPVFGGCGYGCEYVALADYALETGKLEKVEHYAKKAIYKAMTKTQIGIILCANFTLMRLELAEGNLEKSKNILSVMKEQLINFNAKIIFKNNVVYKTMIDLIEGYFYCCMNNLEMIPKWLRTGDFSEATFMLNGIAFPCIIYGKAVMLSENWLELEILCENFKESYEIFNNKLGIIHNTIYESVARYNLYGMDKGLETLESALKLAEMDGVILPFAENGQFIIAMLQELQRRNTVDATWIKTVSEISRRYSNNLIKKQPDIVMLTNRELQVLKLLAKGLTQREIANELFVSVSSIKRYLESLYKKLDANNKTIAIKKALDLNII